MREKRNIIQKKLLLVYRSNNNFQNCTRLARVLCRCIGIESMSHKAHSGSQADRTP